MDFFTQKKSFKILRNPKPIHPPEITKDWNGIDQIVLRTPRGASARAIFKAPKAIRGGIPACFPQFGNCGSLEQHGFARNRMWTIDDNPPPLHANDSSGKSFIDLLLKSSEEDIKCWPHSFEFRLRVALSTDGDLSLISRVRNINGKPFSFSFAHHTYLLVSDISEIRIEGLETVDGVYLGSPNIIAVLDHERKRTFVIRKEGLPDVAVWNPWEKKSKAMVDFGDEEYKQMLCVDGAVIEKPVSLKPGEEWTGRLQLSVVPSSFCSDRLGLDRSGL
uniref:glucose-6-phosphate 1-epimerase n=1 Tax=Cajanus cajan TaxID=3821 RepID=A0A151S9B7_CAJCA|nr:Putative apospory-associated protein C [Cajanus cajan]